MRITYAQFEEIKALVIQETGASVFFYEKKEFSGSAEGYTLFNDDIKIFVCRSSNKSFYNRASIVLLHEYGHAIDFLKNKKHKRMITTWSAGFEPTTRYKDHSKYSREEKICTIKDEWYADYYAISFAKKHNLLELVDILEIEQTWDVRYIYTELVLGKTVTREMRRSWKRELKKDMKYVTVDDIDRLQYV